MLALMNASINATHSVQIYYEDTDLSGVVYHATSGKTRASGLWSTRRR